MEHSRFQVGRVPVDALGPEEALERVKTYLAGGGHHAILFANASKVVQARRDDRLARSLKEADFVGADGISIAIAGLLLRRKRTQRTTGIDLMKQLVSLATQRDLGVFLLGARPGVAEAAHAELAVRYPGVRVVGVRHGYYLSDELPSVVDHIRGARPDLLFVALPSPRKEYFITENLNRLGVPVCQAVGGAFDVLAGRIPRAPRWMRRAGLEWLYRWSREPRRLWRRNLIEAPVFLALLLSEMVCRGARDNSIRAVGEP